MVLNQVRKAAWPAIVFELGVLFDNDRENLLGDVVDIGLLQERYRLSQARIRSNT